MTTTPTSGPPSALARNRQRKLARVAAMAGVLALLQLTSSLEPLDQAILGRFDRFIPQADREHQPILIALDDAAVARWGAPPWGADRWWALARALHAAGVQTAYFVSPPRIWVETTPRDAGELHRASPPGAEPFAVLKSPAILLPSTSMSGELVISSLETAVGPLRPWPYQIHLPTTRRGTVADLTEAAQAGGLQGPSAFCIWLDACPSGGPLARIIPTPSAPGLLPTVSAVDVLDENFYLHRAEDGQAPLVLIGATAPWYHVPIRVGAGAQWVTFAEAVGLSVGAGLAAPAVPALPPLAAALFAFFAVALAAALHRFRYGRIALWFLALGPPAILTAVITIYLSGIVRLPIAAACIAPLIPVVVTFTSNQRLLEDFLGSIIQLVVREGFRYAPRGSLIRSPEEILGKLAGFTRNYLNADRCAYYHVSTGVGRLALVGAYGLPDEALAHVPTRLHQAPWRKAVDSHQLFVLASPMTPELPGKTYLIPIRPSRHLIGIWCVWLPEDADSPSTDKIARILDWIRLRLALDQNAQSRMAGERVTADMERDIAHIRELLATSAEERRQQLATIRALTTPLLVSDFSGSILYVNSALNSLMAANDLGTVSTLREMVYKLRGADGLGGLMIDTFRNNKDVTFTWTTQSQTVYQVTLYPVRDEDHPDTVLGYVAMWVDISTPLELRRLRTTVLDYASDHIRNRLMVAMGYAEMVQETIDDPDMTAPLQLVTNELQAVAEHVANLQNTVAMEEEVGAALPVDLTSLYDVAIARVRALADGKSVTIATDWPEAPQPVVLVASKAQQALNAVLATACERASDGSTIRISVREDIQQTESRLSWVGMALDEETLHHMLSCELGTGPMPGNVRTLAAALQQLGTVAVRSGAGLPTVITWKLARSP